MDSPPHAPQLVAALAAGSVFHGRYEVLRCMRTGGMGAIYEVVHLDTRRRRALKVMLPEIVADPEMRSRFQQEATIAAEIDSEHIVEVFDAGVDTGTGMPFLVMELLKGEDLDTFLERHGKVAAAPTVGFVHQISLALEKTHAANVVHRDLKPENVFVSWRDDGSPRVKILDFGIAKVVAQRTGAARKTRSLGTPMFMAPEQILQEGELGPATDLYALGHIAFNLLVGVPYWCSEAKNMYKLLVAVPNGLPEPASARAARSGVTVPAAFDAWFARATAVQPSARFATASELVATLAAALEVPVPVAPPSGWSSTTAARGVTIARERVGSPATTVSSSFGRARTRSARTWWVVAASAAVTAAVSAVGLQRLRDAPDDGSLRPDDPRGPRSAAVASSEVSPAPAPDESGAADARPPEAAPASAAPTSASSASATAPRRAAAAHGARPNRAAPPPSAPAPKPTATRSID